MWNQLGPTGSPHPARASTCCWRGCPGSSQLPPSSRHPRWCWPCCWPASLLPRSCFQTCCFPVVLHRLQELPCADPAAEPHSPVGRLASHWLGRTCPLPWLGSSSQGCRSPCCHLSEAHPALRLGCLPHPGCFGAYWHPRPQDLMLRDKHWACCHLQEADLGLTTQSLCHADLRACPRHRLSQGGENQFLWFHCSQKVLFFSFDS